MPACPIPRRDGRGKSALYDGPADHRPELEGCSPGVAPTSPFAARRVEIRSVRLSDHRDRAPLVIAPEAREPVHGPAASASPRQAEAGRASANSTLAPAVPRSGNLSGTPGGAIPHLAMLIALCDIGDLAKSVVLAAPARKALLKHRNEAERIMAKLDAFAANPAAFAGSVRKLKGEPGWKRLRVGDFRVIFEETATQIVVAKIGPRGDVYD